ncbi:TIGR02996 domain-containing protein [Fimbriiglobus ruber]|uniref:TIGR02996 domain-containing protein n=1 Tax=Fimbriiglobus ruber TaxID=1908690 RepID=UPI000B4AA5A0|nr:TIGR02996 domain-containing protein [Fimbriiglobus ruber]
MDERQAFLNAIAAGPWDHELPRLVFADWLDEHGEVEEADRQRRYVSSERWLREFSMKHRNEYFSDYRGKYVEDEATGESQEIPPVDAGNEEDIDSSYGKLMYFLKRHVDADHYLPFDTPYGFDDYSDELWQHFRVVTGLVPPEGEHRHAIPPFRCAC